MVQVEPNFSEFERLAGSATVVPVVREIIADALTPVVASRTVGAGAGSFLLESVVGGEKWARYSFVGMDPQVQIRGVGKRFELNDGGGWKAEEGVDPWARLREILGEWKPPEVPWLPRFWGGAVGYVSYDSVRTFEPTVAKPVDLPKGSYEFSFGIGGTLLIFDNVKQNLGVVVPVRTGKGVDLRKAYDAAVARIDACVAKLRAPAAVRPMEPPDPKDRPALPPSSFDRTTFAAMVKKAQQYIRVGDIFQVVLSQRFTVPADGVDPFDVYRALRIVNPSPYMYFVRFEETVIAGASPETLVRVEDGIAKVRPLAGTRHRGKTDEEDAAIEKELLADPKEVSEHVMLVDLGRNDIGRISKAGTVRISDQMVIERYSHVMHIVSNVSGEVLDGRDAIDVLRSTFPAGTLSGAPKVRAMQIIDELEGIPRGIYGGAVGYIGFDGNLDMAIAIRTVVARDGNLLLQAGAGIVEASDPDGEYEETLNKARAGLNAIHAAKAAGSAKP